MSIQRGNQWGLAIYELSSVRLHLASLTAETFSQYSAELLASATIGNATEIGSGQGGLDMTDCRIDYKELVFTFIPHLMRKVASGEERIDVADASLVVLRGISDATGMERKNLEDWAFTLHEESSKRNPARTKLFLSFQTHIVTPLNIDGETLWREMLDLVNSASDLNMVGSGGESTGRSTGPTGFTTDYSSFLNPEGGAGSIRFTTKTSNPDPSRPTWLPLPSTDWRGRREER